MKKSTKSKTPAAPQATKAPAKKAVAKKAAAPATVAPAQKKAVTKKAAAPVAKPTPAPAPVKKPAAKKAPAKKKTAPVAVATTTTIVVKVDVGFGNALFLRGDGPGLSWDTGLPMVCVADDEWSATLTGGSGSILCKVLINDETWSTGEDFLVEAGTTPVLTPTF